MSDSTLNFLRSAIPTVVTAIGGPLAGVAAGFIADKLGLSEKTVESVTNAINGMGPEQLIQMKQIDADLQKFFSELGIKELALENADRDSARKRQVELKDYTPAVLAWIVTAGFFGMLAFLVLQGFPEGNKEALFYMLGTLQTAWTGIVAYYFGSTKSNKDAFKNMSDTLTATTNGKGN